MLRWILHSSPLQAHTHTVSVDPTSRTTWKRLVHLKDKCIAEDVDARPSFDEVVQGISGPQASGLWTAFPFVAAVVLFGFLVGRRLLVRRPYAQVSKDEYTPGHRGHAEPVAHQLHADTYVLTHGETHGQSLYQNPRRSSKDHLTSSHHCRQGVVI